MSAILSTATWAEPATTADQRTSIGLDPGEKTEFLAEMRQMLASIHGIVAGIGAGDREAIAAAARMSGNRMSRATPTSVRAKLPQAFREIGGPTHMLFEEIAIRAETDDMEDLVVLTGTALEQCMLCHARYRAD